MPRNNSGLKKGANRPDALVPKTMSAAGQPNGRTRQIELPDGLPYGEKQRLQQAMSAAPARTAPTPSAPRRPIQPQPTQDYSSPQGASALQNAIAGWQPGPTVPLAAPSRRPWESPQSGLNSQPDSILGQPSPGALSDLFDQLAQSTGSTELAALAARARGVGA